MHSLLINNLLSLIDFSLKKIYHERDNEIPNIEGGIPVLSQFLEFPSIATSYSNAQVYETKGHKVDDIVNGIDKLSLIDNEEPVLKE